MLSAGKLVKKAKIADNIMADALLHLDNGGMSYGEVSKMFAIPKSTLFRHHTQPNLKTKGRQPVFEPIFERELAEHIKRFDDHLVGLTVSDIQMLAYQMAVRNEIPHRFNNETEMAGRRWVKGFLSRAAGSGLSIRQPECLSMNRFRSFTKENCDKFFEILAEIVETHHLDGSRIYNMDESGFSTVQKKGDKVISTRGKRRVLTISSGEKGRNTTVVCCVNAVGDWHVKPFIIFKGTRISRDHAIGLMEGRFSDSDLSIINLFSFFSRFFPPTGARINGSPSGYIDTELFIVWLEYFIATVKPSIERKVLLVLDGHSTHTKCLTAINMAAENGVILLQLPAHCTHRLQPLDVSFFKPLKVAYNAEITSWLRKNPKQIVTSRQFSALFSSAYKKSTSYDNAANGFSGTGIWPVHKDVFLASDFAIKHLDYADFSRLNVPLQEILPVPDNTPSPMLNYSHAVELTSPIYISGLKEKQQMKAEKEQEKKMRLEARESKRKMTAAIKTAKSLLREQNKKERERKLKEAQLAIKNRKKKIGKQKGMIFLSLLSS